MMPTLLVQTAVKVDSSKRDALLKEASKEVAAVLGKPEQYVMVSYKEVVRFSSQTTCLHIWVTAYGVFLTRCTYYLFPCLLLVGSSGM